MEKISLNVLSCITTMILIEVAKATPKGVAEMNLCKDCISKNICGNPNVTGCISYTKQDEKFLPINCYVRNASGRIAGNSYRHPSKCTRCNGTGEINYYTLTNDDFLRMATTEQLAEGLTKVVLDLISWNNDPKPSEVRNVLKSWLKQPHTVKE